MGICFCFKKGLCFVLYIIFVAGLLVFIVLYIYLHIAIEGAVVGFVFFFSKKEGII